jgi:hypothetical protein
MQMILVSSWGGITEHGEPPTDTVAPDVAKLLPEIVIGTFPAVGNPLPLEIAPIVGGK